MQTLYYINKELVSQEEWFSRIPVGYKLKVHKLNEEASCIVVTENKELMEAIM